MKPYYDHAGIAIYNADALAALRSMPERSVQTCVTSPPYWGLRDYGMPGQLGLESAPEEYVARMVAVFAEVRRVLADDGTIWLNLGDSYVGSANAGGESSRTCHSAPNATARNLKSKRGVGLKPKDLVGIPWRVAFALQADGWYLRSDIIWSKPNPMPESVTDRPTKAHEYLFLLSKSERYFYDAEAIAEPAIHAGQVVTLGEKSLSRGQAVGMNVEASGNGCAASVTVKDTRNRRTVWTVATQPYAEAHFAVFPPDLIRPCILAGSRPCDVVLDPFNGSGTTGQVALEYGRRYVGIELNADYIELTRKRLARVPVSMFGGAA